MGLKQSQGFRSLNMDPSFNVEPRTKVSREYVGAGYHDDLMETLGDIARVEGEAKADRSMKINAATLTHPIECPCCKQPVSVPTLEIIVDHYGLTPLEARVLGAIWRGRGMPVMTERVFDAMYIDDPDGGPTPSKMYLAFKVALCHLRKKIEGSGVDVVNVGYRRGYRLSIGGN